MNASHNLSTYFSAMPQTPNTATPPPMPGAAHSNVDNVLEHEADIDHKFESQKALHALIEKGKLLFSLIRDYATGRYREAPYWVIGAAAFALLYVLSPIDLIPDMIPGIGYLDDAAVVALCLKLIEVELTKYRRWKEGTKGATMEATVVPV
jgi:uncharacterized membrane protein YkvA (DUF1232 family)